MKQSVITCFQPRYAYGELRLLNNCYNFASVSPYSMERSCYYKLDVFVKVNLILLCPNDDSLISNIRWNFIKDEMNKNLENSISISYKLERSAIFQLDIFDTVVIIRLLAFISSNCSFYGHCKNDSVLQRSF